MSLPNLKLLPLNLSTSQKVIVVSVTAGVALLTVLASYMTRRKCRPLRQNNRYRSGGRRTRNSMRSPNDIASVANSKTSARSLSPGGSVHTLNDALSYASGSLGAGTIGSSIPLSPQQLGVMGMEKLDIVINYWEDALSTHALGGGTMQKSEDSEFYHEIQNLLDIAYSLQEQSELLFLDERSVLFRNDENRSESEQKGAIKRSNSDPNFDSAESFASALDQIADLREFEDFQESFSDFERYPLFQNALRQHEEQPIPYRILRTEQVNCSSDTEYLAKLHCVRLAFQYLFRDPQIHKWIADTGRQILTDIMCLGDKDPKDFLVSYEAMLTFLQDENNWVAIERELDLRSVKAMTFYDIVLDFIILDAFKDLDSPPSSVLAVIQNRFLSNGFKETALTTAVWSVLKAKKRLLKFQDGFMAHFYLISEQISPLMAWGFFGSDENLKEICQYFHSQTMEFLTDIYNFQKCRFSTVEELAEDILRLMHERVSNIEVKFSQ